jgi:hypothetical protein
VKNPDYAKLVETIHDRVVQKLSPYGILVEHTPPEPASGMGTVSEFTLKIPDPDKSKPGLYQELTFHFLGNDAVQCHQDSKNLDCLPQAWARICADWAPSLFDNAAGPPADEVDWRPDETLPEDFYAA